jgi:hypothetical protein
MIFYGKRWPEFCSCRSFVPLSITSLRALADGFAAAQKKQLQKAYAFTFMKECK